MRNRDLVVKKLEQLDSNLTRIEYYIKRQGSPEDIYLIINESKEKIEQTKDIIQQEPFSPNEINPLN